jgi:hypothetical protein
MLIAAPVLLAGVVAVAARVRRPAAADRPLRPIELGLDRLPADGLFVQVAPPGSMVARTALNRLARAVAEAGRDVTIVEYQPDRAPLALARPPGALLLVFADGDGRIRRHWTAAPGPGELRRLLGGEPAYEPVAAGSRKNALA